MDRLKDLLFQQLDHLLTVGNGTISIPSRYKCYELMCRILLGDNAILGIDIISVAIGELSGKTRGA